MVSPQRATVSYLEAKVRDDGWETVRPEQRHHQLLQALVNLKVLPEEWRHKETTISKRQWKWVWMISHGFYIRLFSCQSQFWNMSQYVYILHLFDHFKWRETPRQVQHTLITSMSNQKSSSSCWISGCSSTEPPPSRIPSRKLIRTSSTRYTLHCSKHILCTLFVPIMQKY